MYVCIYTHTHTHTHTYIYIYIYMYTYIYICIYIYVYVYVYIYTYIFTGRVRVHPFSESKRTHFREAPNRLALTRDCFTSKSYCGSQSFVYCPTPPAKPTLLLYYRVNPGPPRRFAFIRYDCFTSSRLCTNQSSFHSSGPPALPTLLQSYCTVIGQYTRPPPDPSFVCHTPYNIGNSNIVYSPKVRLDNRFGSWVTGYE